VSKFTFADGCANLNPLIATLKPQSNKPSYSNKVIGTLAVDGWAVTFGTGRRGQGNGFAACGWSKIALFHYFGHWLIRGLFHK